jgi:hypothetical protein
MHANAIVYRDFCQTARKASRARHNYRNQPTTEQTREPPKESRRTKKKTEQRLAAPAPPELFT